MPTDQGGTFDAPPAEALLAIHADQITRFGGPEGTRNPGALEAALARPFNLVAYAPDTISLARLAVAIAYSIARINHPFVDGNKRVAFAALVVTLDMNGLILDVAETHAAEIMTAVAAGAMPEDELVAWVDRNAYPLLSPDPPPAESMAA